MIYNACIGEEHDWTNKVKEPSIIEIVTALKENYLHFKFDGGQFFFLKNDFT